MDNCPKSPDCPLFQNTLIKDNDLTDLLKRVYCNRDYENCARYFIARNFGVENLPRDLKPYQSTVAKRLYIDLMQMENTLTAN